jgi:hypothetical protein
MPSSRLHYVVGAMLVVLTTTGCSMLVPNEGLEPGWRRLSIAVDTIGTDRPAILLVADDSGQVVGRAVPNIVAPNTHERVTFDVPPGRSWRILRNGQVVILATDNMVPVTIYSGGPSDPGVQWAEPGSLTP